MSQRLVSIKVLAAAAVVSLGAFVSSSQAQQVRKDLSAFGWMAEMDPGIDLTVLSTSNNGITLSLEKSAVFTQQGLDASGVIQPLSISFMQISPTAVPNIVIDDETVTNQTGLNWSGFRFIVEGGLRANGTLPHFDAAASAGFSVSPFTNEVPITDPGTGLVKEIDATGGTLPSGALGNMFRPGFTSGQLVIAADPFTSGGMNQTFQFKEQPITGAPVIPLPAAAWTSLSGLLGLGLISNAKGLKKLLS